MCENCEHDHHDHNVAQEYDISLLIPIYKEGEGVADFLEEVIGELDKTKRTWEIIILDNAVKGNSLEFLKRYADESDNIHIVVMTHPGVAVTDKTKKYMAGHQLAQGKYIITMDGDGQDDPHELPKFLEKLDEGYDFVIGYKAKRKDGLFYVLSSRVANALNRALTGLKIHDMNNGFKAYTKEVATCLKLRGGMFRFLPAMLASEKKKIAEVPVNHRKRMYADPKFNFISRLKGGVFDLLTTVALTNMQQTPMHFLGAVGILAILKGIILIVIAYFIKHQLTAILLGVMGISLFVIAMMSFMAGLVLAYQLWQTPHDEYDFGIVEIYSGK